MSPVIPIYDTSGPYSDLNAAIDVRKGLRVFGVLDCGAGGLRAIK
jgi:hypothetical protein